MRDKAIFMFDAWGIFILKMSYQKVHIRAHLLETQASKEIIFSGKCFSVKYFTKTEYLAHKKRAQYSHKGKTIA